MAGVGIPIPVGKALGIFNGEVQVRKKLNYYEVIVNQSEGHRIAMVKVDPNEMKKLVEAIQKDLSA